jgi:hypothetical protein
MAKATNDRCGATKATIATRVSPSHLFQSAVPVCLLFSIVCAVSVVSSTQPLPDPATLARSVRAAAGRDFEVQRRYTYIEQRRDVKVSKLGKVSIGPLRTFEVYPSDTPGRTYKRLIAIDGTPLDRAALERRDEQHRRDLATAAERQKRETPGQRAARLRADAEAIRQRDAILDDALAVFEPVLLGRELVDREPVIVAALAPRRTARVTTSEGGWFKHFEGRAWIAEADHQIAKVELRAVEDVTIGWGIVGRLHRGSRLVLTRRKVEGAWLPAEIRFDAAGRTLLLRSFELSAVTTYSDYKRVVSMP